MIMAIAIYYCDRGYGAPINSNYSDSDFKFSAILVAPMAPIKNNIQISQQQKQL